MTFLTFNLLFIYAVLATWGMCKFLDDGPDPLPTLWNRLLFFCGFPLMLGLFLIVLAFTGPDNRPVWSWREVMTDSWNFVVHGVPLDEVPTYEGD